MGKAGREPRVSWARIVPAAAMLLWLVSPACAQLQPEKTYYGVNRAIPVRVLLPAGMVDIAGQPAREGAPDAGEAGPPVPETMQPDPPERTIEQAPAAEIWLMREGSLDALERASVLPGRVNLAALFPVLWTRRDHEVLYAQLMIDGRAHGAPLVLQPLMTPAGAHDELTAGVLAALDAADADAVRRLASLSPADRARARQRVRITSGTADGQAGDSDSAAPHRVCSGIRAWVDRAVVFETTLGSMTILPRADAAPNTAFTFLHLAEGGLYDDTIFHRVINSDARGRPFIVQGGDPRGVGDGGPGFAIDFEPSSLRHDFGVVSAARLPTDPNSAGSQFFICLSREACAGLDGAYTGFAEVVEGADTVLALAAQPVVAQNPDDPASPLDRPAEPARVISVRVIDAPPMDARPQRIVRPPSPPVER